MPYVDSSYAAARLVTLALAGVLVVLLSIIGYRAWQRSRVTPAERERRRRAWLVATGKMGDAVLVDFRGDHVFYCYDVRGVSILRRRYSRLPEQVPADLSNVPSVCPVRSGKLNRGGGE
jgi:hypothetical protein